MTKNISVGRQGEKFAQEYLIKNGYKIIETNRHFSRFCEVDIIALDRDTLVFCEVKTRTSGLCGKPLEAITKTKYQHIKNGIYYYRQEHPEYKKCRIDAISVLLKPELKIEHIKNI